MDIIWEWDAEKLQDGHPHWFVFTSSFAHNRVYDVLSNSYIVDICAENEDAEFNQFSDCLKQVCAYRFAGRAQYEIGFTGKFPFVDAEEVDRLAAKRKENPDHYGFSVNVRNFTSVDVYGQLLMNWDAFAHYVFAHRAEIVTAKNRHVSN